MEEEWDNVVILDGCRYDQFKKSHSFETTLEPRQSLGSSTPEFLRKNLKDKYYDTVYITANPQYLKQGLSEVFHDIIDVWDLAWDQNKKTVPPNAMVNISKKYYKKYLNKRIIIHFMQPHYPFIGGTGIRKPRNFWKIFTGKKRGKRG